MPHHRLELLISACLFFLSQFVSANHANADDALAKKRLKVYLLVGQSNMQGHAQIQTLASLADDPKTAALLTTMRGADGQPKVCERVWISSVGSAGGVPPELTEQTGKLTAGFGAQSDRIGPEYSFGVTLEERLQEPILLIKAAWGGKNLHTNFRPPGSGPYVWSEQQITQIEKRGEDLKKIKTEKEQATGVYYRATMQHVRFVLSDIKRVVPTYDAQAGYELAGFVWFQGWNDMVDSGHYPKRMQPNGYDDYANLLSQFIRDVRKELNAPKLPFVIGVMGVGGTEQDKKAPQANFREAQRKPGSLPEFVGNVHVVETAPFWVDELDALNTKREQLNRQLNEEFKREPQLSREAKEAARQAAFAEKFTPDELARLERGVSNFGFHYLGASRTIVPIGKAFAEALLTNTKLPLEVKQQPPQVGEMAGYLLVPHERVDSAYNAGFSMYVAAWPLLKNYPGSRFQTGLFGTWMFAQHEAPKPKGIYSDIEGGLGWWRDTRFATETPKFIMGGVALNFVEWANGPGAGKGRDWKNPQGHYAIAQLSPWVLWPPDGLNLKQGTNGELFGYGYLPLPLTDPKPTTKGTAVPTGNQCWTLFLNTGNFKGPVTFFLPEFWTLPTLDQPEVQGKFLDSQPSDPNKAIQMETQHVPAFTATDATGQRYARIAPTQFPALPNDAAAPLIHRVTAYKRSALWDQVNTWFNGGQPAPGKIDATHATTHKFSGGGGATWRIYEDKTEREQRVPVAWNTFANPIALDELTYSYRWNRNLVRQTGTLATLPEYYKLEKDKRGNDQWVVVNENEVPKETGLSSLTFPQKIAKKPEPYETPYESDPRWLKPGPAAGPFESTLGDGSTLTYYWYRFADQPALRHADFTDTEREALQKRVELLHRNWTKEREYLPANTIGTLADLDPAVLVIPPKGLEIGYVPIVTRQEKK